MAKINVGDWGSDDLDDRDDLFVREERFTSKKGNRGNSKPHKKEEDTTDKKDKKFALPVAGDIVMCFFPERDNPFSPGPKPRPCIVLAETFDEDGNAILHLVAGTSKKLDRVYPHEFVVRATDDIFHEKNNGLRVDTKFDIGHLIQVPYDGKWLLAHTPTKSINPVIGKLNMDERLAICDILDRVKEQLIVHNNSGLAPRNKHHIKP